MMRLKQSVIILAITLALPAMAGAQGLYWESLMAGGSATGEGRSETYYMPGMFKIVEKGDQQRVMIFRLDRKMMYMVNPKEKTYSEITFAEIEKQMQAVSKKRDERMAEAKKQMEKLPPDQRKQLEEQMGRYMMFEDPHAKSELTGTGEKKTISGYSATKYVARKGGTEFMTIWVTRDVKDWAAMKGDFERFSSSMGSLSQITAGISEAYQKIEGFPIQTEIGGMTNTVTKVERRSTPASQFDVPAGYTKVEAGR
jgi:hypothetical protein